MSITYTKLFSSITESTIWVEPYATRIVWVSMLAMADRMGRIWASIPGLARRAGVTLEECETALARFQAPDKYSRTAEHEGRRIEEMDGGWRLLNYDKYRAMRDEEARREYQREWDRKNRQKVSESDRARPRPTQAEAEAEAEAEAVKAEAPRKRGSRLSSDWTLPDDLKAWALTEQPSWTDAHLRKVAANFLDHWLAAPRGTKLDWPATWRKWVRNDGPMRGGALPIPAAQSSAKAARAIEEGRAAASKSVGMPDDLRERFVRKPPETMQ